jgi:hypothetical protein
MSSFEFSSTIINLNFIRDSVITDLIKILDDSHLPKILIVDTEVNNLLGLVTAQSFLMVNSKKKNSTLPTGTPSQKHFSFNQKSI